MDTTFKVELSKLLRENGCGDLSIAAMDGLLQDIEAIFIRLILIPALDKQDRQGLEFYHNETMSQ